MTQDEVRREIAADEIARGTVPPFDVTPYLQADLNALDSTLIDEYIAQVRKIRPSSRIEDSSREKILSDINATAEQDNKVYPTVTGLLFFCREPQRFLPQSSVEFLHLWGPKLTTLGPDGSRWRLNREFFGTLPQIIDGLENLLLERVASRSFIDTFRRREEPEYPRFALREAVVNAVAHRDYSMRGSHIQLQLYPDRLEIYTPGGLPPPVTVDNIEDEKSTRNENIVGLLQDYGYMERRGYGFDGIVATMREAGLAPPQVRDDGASFGLCLRSHVLMEPEAIAWLRQFNAFGLSPQERLALAYLRVNERLYNRDYVRLSGCTSVEATTALRQMVNKGVVVMKNTRGGAYYTLSDSLPVVQPNLLDTPLTDEEMVLEFTRTKGAIRRRDVIEMLGCTPRYATNLLLRLRRQGKLKPHGMRKGATYSLSTLG